MSNYINIGIIGLGTVGASVVKVLKRNSRLIEKRAGVKIKIKKAADIRNRKSVAGKAYTKNVLDVISDPDISIVVEAMGGVDPAKKYVLAAIRSGKHVVTSNKELIAKHGKGVIDAARKAGVQVLFEGSVCGGIPIIHSIRECLAADDIHEISGIVNGTTNYILTKMTKKGMSFNAALKEARGKGFAEADPKMDMDGSDAAYKAAILAHVSSGSFIDPSKIYREGILNIAMEDIEYAKEIGYVIKLLAIIKISGRELEVRVHPTLIEKNHPLAQVNNNFNAVFVKADAMGDAMFYGEGAGGLPTASSVLSDVIDIAKGASCCSDCCSYYPPAKNLKIKNIGEIRSRYYIRLEAPDRSGVLAGISGVFTKKKISIQEVVQRESKGKNAQIVIILHENKEKDVQDALRIIAKLPVVKRIRSVIRVGIE
ncbi:MAG: homoserine dehydrogenase [bacterium]